MTEKRESIGALWIQKSKDGKTYLSGNIQGQKVVVFKNDMKKDGEKYPDYRVYLKMDNGNWKKDDSDVPF